MRLLRTSFALLILVSTACVPLRAAMGPTSLDIGGRRLLSAQSQEVESALIPARGRSLALRVEEGVSFERLQRFLVMAAAVGVKAVELEHGEGAQHVFPLAPPVKVERPYLVVALGPDGFYFASEDPPPRREGERGSGPTIPLVEGRYPYDALEQRLRAEYSTVALDGVIIGAAPSISAVDVLRTWDVVARFPAGSKVMLAGFDPP